MTIKRVNSTGRRRIPRDRVDITVYDGQPRTFDARINLERLLFLPEAAVYLEANSAGSRVTERFSFGVVGDIRRPASPALKEVEGENVWFTLKIVDRTERFGRILGIADNIRPQHAGKQTATGRRGILPIEPVELGQQLWRLDFRDHDVFLLVNKDVPSLAHRVHSDPLFKAAIYPEIVRRVLAEAISQNVDLDERDDRWPILWLRFGTKLHPDSQDPPKSDDPEEHREEWIEQIVDAFCESHDLKARFLAATREGSCEP